MSKIIFLYAGDKKKKTRMKAVKRDEHEITAKASKERSIAHRTPFIQSQPNKFRLQYIMT
jgi:spore coat polysaccharide biosynthesis protein SpsF (cytidylyltransferase family)